MLMTSTVVLSFILCVIMGIVLIAVQENGWLRSVISLLSWVLILSAIFILVVIMK